MEGSDMFIFGAAVFVIGMGGVAALKALIGEISREPSRVRGDSGRRRSR